jgi:glyoxylase I family protein
MAIAQRLHHTAYVTKDQEATRAFYEDVLGFPLIATWSEVDELFGAERVYCHTFFQFANKEDQDLFDPPLTPSPFRHIALKVDAEEQADLERRLEAAKWEGSFVLEHGYCRSLYAHDPNGMLVEFTVDAPEAAQINADRRLDAHDTLKRWLAGDHTSNNNYR